MALTVLGAPVAAAPKGHPQVNHKPEIHKKGSAKTYCCSGPNLAGKRRLYGIYGRNLHGESSQTKLCYWAGNTRADLPIPEGNFGYTTSITEYDGIVYTTGAYYNEYYEYTNCYWKNSTRVDLPSGMFVKKNFFDRQMYLIGSYLDRISGLSLPCYWIGNTRVDLPVPDGYEGEVISIDVQGRDNLCLRVLFYNRL